jgi:hypothetical protein
MARQRNTIRTETLTLSTTPHVRTYLRQLLATGLYGKNDAEAAERLLTRVLDDLLERGRLRRKEPRGARAATRRKRGAD